MGFFDLNIPYLESERHVADKSSLKGRRLKLALKAMELGFTGVAYNRTLRGVMSESDRCSTILFPLTKLAASSSSSFVAAVKFHRELLSVPVSSPFRQYTRLTVIVDAPAQASALNPGNPILRSYDIVAVRPMNQHAFDQACQTSEVDMIAIDFSDKLPFRLKQPMVKAAIKRGVCFEITYSGLIADTRSRRQVISNCKLLVDWTRGQNLIVSSSAPSATELRGPQDAANLFSLLGLSMERAKAAISKNCRSLLANALRKKQFYKEAIRVEKIPSGVQVNSEEPAFKDWLKWDPISSGEGDLLLDDMEKSFAISNSVKGTVKTIDFTSSLNGLPVHGLQIKDLLSVSDTSLKPPITDNSIPIAMEIEEIAAVEKLEVQAGLNHLHENQSSLGTSSKEQQQFIMSEGPTSYSRVTSMHLDSTCQGFKLSSNDVFKVQPVFMPLQKEVETLASDANYGYEASGLEESAMSSLHPPNGSCTNSEEPLPVLIKKLNNSADLKAKLLASETESHGSPSTFYGGSTLDDGKVHATKIIVPITDDQASAELPNPLYESSPSEFQLEQTNVENLCAGGLDALDCVAVEKVPNKINTENAEGIPVASPDTSSEDAHAVRQQCKMINKSVKLDDGLHIEGSLNLRTDSNGPILHGMMGNRHEMDIIPDYQGFGKSHTGRGRRKQNSPHKPFLFPFKRNLTPMLSKKMSRKLKRH